MLIVMVIDSSAIIAILQNEPGAENLIDALLDAAVRRLSAANLLAAAIVMQARYGDAGEREVDVLLQRLGIDVVPVTPQHAEIARSAYRRYGKGRHPAGLNFGDCFAYALSKAMGESLLFVGEDFGQTDVQRA
jgi:ribonuclease VapC